MTNWKHVWDEQFLKLMMSNFISSCAHNAQNNHIRRLTVLKEKNGYELEEYLLQSEFCMTVSS